MNKKYLKVIVPIAATVVMTLGCTIPGVGKNNKNEDLLNTIQTQTVDAGKTQIEMPEIEVPEAPVIPEIEVPEVKVEVPEVNIDVPVEKDDANAVETLEDWLMDYDNYNAVSSALGIDVMIEQYKGTYEDIYILADGDNMYVMFQFTAEGFDQSMADAGVADQLQDYMNANITTSACLQDILLIFNASGKYPQVYGFAYEDINGNILANIEYTIDEIMAEAQP